MITLEAPLASAHASTRSCLVATHDRSSAVDLLLFGVLQAALPGRVGGDGPVRGAGPRAPDRDRDVSEYSNLLRRA
jgi:hypothetical protein